MGGLTRPGPRFDPAAASSGGVDPVVGETMTRVLVIAGYPALRAGLRALLAQERDILLVESDPVRPDDAAVPHVIVADAGSAADETLDDLTETFPHAAFLLVGGDPAVDGPGLENGPVGYLAPNVDGVTLATAVRSLAQGLTVIDPALILASGMHIHSRSQTAPVA